MIIFAVFNLQMSDHMVIPCMFVAESLHISFDMKYPYSQDTPRKKWTSKHGDPMISFQIKRIVAK